MDWKKSICLVTVTSLIILTMAGCSKSGENATTSSTTSTTTPPTAVAPLGERPSAPVMDLATAATKLGITEQQLRDALGSDTQKPPDLAAAAKTLGITEESLQEALDFQGGTPPAGVPPTGVPPTGAPPTGIPPTGSP